MAENERDDVVYVLREVEDEVVVEELSKVEVEVVDEEVLPAFNTPARRPTFLTKFIKFI